MDKIAELLTEGYELQALLPQIPEEELTRKAQERYENYVRACLAKDPDFFAKDVDGTLLA